MEYEEYKDSVLRTESDTGVAREALEKGGDQLLRLLHSAMGMATEGCEALDQLKKAIFYGLDLDTTNVFEEIGDTLYYAVLGLIALDRDLGEAMYINTKKLAHRYPDKFSKFFAENRDLKGERDILEGS